jgi:hypothetical protein
VTHYFVKTKTLSHPLHGRIVIAHRFGKVIAIQHTPVGGYMKCYHKSSEQISLLQSMGIDTEALERSPK